jgi:Domain of unknown function (DUF4124)
MVRIRLSYLVVGLITFLCSFVSVALADFYGYRDAQGQHHFTNDPSTIPVVYRQQAMAERRKAAGPLTLTTVPMAMANPSASLVSPAVQPITTEQFQRLQLGVSSREVTQRLGEPALKISQGRHELSEPSPSGMPVTRIVRLETWYYPGTVQVLATRLVFHNGVLAQKFQ